MDGKTPPEGFTPDGKNAGVYVKMENGKATAYWKAGKLMTPAEYAKEYMGDFDNSTKIKASAIEYADRIEKGDGAKPPAGFSPIPGSKKGGYGGDIGLKPGEPIVKSDALVDAAWLGALARDEARNAVRWGIYPLTANGDDSTLARAAADRVVARMLGDGDSDESGAAKRLTRCIAASGADCVYNAILSEMPGMRLAHPPESKGNKGIPILDGVTLDDAFSVNGGGGF